VNGPSTTASTPERGSRPRVVLITGPTASGKSALALALAEALDGEIVSADSMQVYRGLDIGTAKPTPEEQARVRHHLIDVADPDEVYSAGRFRAEADRAIRDAGGRGKAVLVCGGTALYVKALLQGLAAGPPRDAQVRGELEARWEGGERARLHAELREADPALAARLHPNDRARILRGLEVWRLSGGPLSALQAGHGFSDRPYDALRLGAECPRDELYRRIDQRVTRMVDAGWVEEVRRLLDAGVAPGSPALQAIGYAELGRYLRDGGDWGAVVSSIQQATRNFAKRQMTWFRRMELHWVRSEERTAVMARVKIFLQTPPAPL